MSDRTEDEEAAAAEATRMSIMDTIRSRAETVVEQLQSDVFRLLEDAYRPVGSLHAPDPPLRSEASRRREEERDDEHEDERHDKRAREHRHLDAELRRAVIDIVRAEIAALDVAALVKAEIDAQLRTVTRLLQERVKAFPKSNLQKIAPILSRRGR